MSETVVIPLDERSSACCKTVYILYQCKLHGEARQIDCRFFEPDYPNIGRCKWLRDFHAPDLKYGVGQCLSNEAVANCVREAVL